MADPTRPLIEVHERYFNDQWPAEDPPKAVGNFIYVRDEHANWLRIEGLKGGGFEVMFTGAKLGRTHIQPVMGNVINIIEGATE